MRIKNHSNRFKQLRAAIALTMPTAAPRKLVMKNNGRIENSHISARGAYRHAKKILRRMRSDGKRVSK